ncbi:hypothetical protein B0H11DRAFT_1917032 [Mycena galericulata]|nr:hypothetical protein B0H11DRAFT_1917032 [Mycena galericulata]
MTSDVEDRRERQTGYETNMVQRYPMIIPAVGVLLIHIDLRIWLWWRGDGGSDGLVRHAQCAGSFVLLPIEMTKESARRGEASGEDDSKKGRNGSRESRLRRGVGGAR